jgi:hypothetical protein
MKQAAIYMFFLSTLFLSCHSSTVGQKATVKSINTDSLNKFKTNSNRGGYTVSKDSLISQLAEMITDTLDCSADVYWKIVKRGKESVPLLIESLTDTTMTNIYDYCKKGTLNVGEVSYFALEEIAEFPAFVVTHMQFDVITDGCWSFYDYLYDNKNKPEYQEMVRTFYQTNTYKYEEFKKSELTDCYKKYKISGRYKWKE